MWSTEYREIFDPRGKCSPPLPNGEGWGEGEGHLATPCAYISTSAPLLSAILKIWHHNTLNLFKPSPRPSPVRRERENVRTRVERSSCRFTYRASLLPYTLRPSLRFAFSGLQSRRKYLCIAQYQMGNPELVPPTSCIAPRESRVVIPVRAEFANL